ncbi:MAG: hypothetical protein ACFE8O_06980 [Candidatus Hermodarchaeota archaeon]
MSKKVGIKDGNSEEERTLQCSSPDDKDAARKIIADYLDQVQARLPPEVANEMIPELWSHLLEQATQSSGHLTVGSAWEAVVSMGSPDIVAREFRREKEERRITEVRSFLDVLTPQYRKYFGYSIIGIVIIDLVLIIFLSLITLLNLSQFGFVIMLGLVAQIIVVTGIAVSYIVFAALSRPSGFSLTEIFHSIIRDHERNEELVVPRTQKRVQKRVKKYKRFTGRGPLRSRLRVQIIAGLGFLGLAIISFLSIFRYFFATIVLFWLAFILLTQASLTAIRILVGDSSLATARFLASINTLYALVWVWLIVLFFYGPLGSFNMLFPAPGGFRVGNFESEVLPLIWWLGPLLILLAIIAMTIELIEVNVYIQPLHNSYPVDVD